MTTSRDLTQFGLLGPVQAVRDGASLPLGGPRQRAVLVRLLLDPGRVVPADALVADVWDGNPPPTARKTLQKYVSELRKTLGPATLKTSGSGYLIDAARGTVDSHRFEQLLAGGDCARALALWRGEALADLPDVLFAAAERSRLSELRLVATERQLTAELESGRHVEAAAALSELVTLHPLRERLCGLLVLALYRSGRQAEALQALTRHRRRLADELGVDPADELVALEQSILRHDESLDPRPHEPRPVGNVRLPVSSFVGRKVERARLAAALRESRLVTLTGPGGVGKTRLAVETVADTSGDFPGGVWLVDLAGLIDPALVAHQVAATLSIGEHPGQDDAATVVAALEHRKPVVLVLDNCEHVIDGCGALVDAIVRRCPATRVLATSRRPLGVDGEHLLFVPPLPDQDACRLFTERSRLTGTADEEAVLEHVAGICRSLDGLPLAVELAAGQMRVLAPGELAARLDDRLEFASRRFDALPRQRTLRDMVAWSHGLLPVDTRRLFARLGAFASTMTLDAATAVLGEDALPHISTLVDHSLLVRETGPRSSARFRLLDTLKLFAVEQLVERGDEEDARRAHAEFYLDLAVQAGPHLFGHDEEEWASRIEAEEPNLHLALAWAADHDRVLALRLGVAMWPYWDLRWRETFGMRHLSTAIEGAGTSISPPLRAWTLTAMADLVASHGEARLATQWAAEAVEIFRARDDMRGLATALVALGAALTNGADLDAADAALAEALTLAEAAEDRTLSGLLYSFMSLVAGRRGDHELAERLGRAELGIWIELDSRRGEAHALRHLAVTMRNLGDLEQTKQLCDRALAIVRRRDDAASAAHCNATLADVARLRGNADGARELYEVALDEFRLIGDRRCTAATYRNLAALAHDQGDHLHSAALLANAVRIRHQLGDHAGLAECFDALSADMTALGRPQDAARLRSAAEERRHMRVATATPEPGLDETVESVLADTDLGGGDPLVPRPRGSAGPPLRGPSRR
jgi:predicted ATPase/DNA-binding SARP family transcriptional activator